jgi:hypothetical protein
MLNLILIITTILIKYTCFYYNIILYLLIIYFCAFGLRLGHILRLWATAFCRDTIEYRHRSLWLRFRKRIGI